MEVLDLQTYLELKENGFEFEGQSYLFWEYIRIYHELIERGDNPKFFLENGNLCSMKQWEERNTYQLRTCIGTKQKAAYTGRISMTIFHSRKIGEYF